ncbi:MAG: hypothetical protein ACO1QB_05610 [Verrucomicrobiales bacterium]
MRDLLAVVALTSALTTAANPMPHEHGAPSATLQLASLAGINPSITLVPEGTGVSLTFTGVLQSSPGMDGPWTDLPNAQSPYLQERDTEQKFFRARSPGVHSVFSSPVIIDLTMTAPFQHNFELAHAGMPDGIFPPLREKPWFQGKVKIGTMELPVTYRVRGNSSLQECPFPKLKMKISRETRAGTPFADAREIKIGTHCAEGGSGPVGRLREQTAAYRETLAYEAMGILGFITPRVRRAQIDYIDTTPAREGSETGWQLSRDALIFDDPEVIAEQLGGRALSDEEKAELRNANFDPQLVTDLRMFHALLGNWDYTLSADGRETWNADVIELPNLQLVPVAGDFDLSSWVTGVVRRMAPHDYFPELEVMEREVRYEVETIYNDVGAESFALAKERFEAKRAALEARIQSSNMDEAGRQNAMKHVSAFFWAVDSLGRK